MGGIENPRFLLNCNSQLENGIGNYSDLVGRFFMDHHVLDLGFVFLTKAGAKWRKTHNDIMYISPTKKFMYENEILNCGIRIRSGFLGESSIDLLKQELKVMACNSELFNELFDMMNYEIWCPEETDKVNVVKIRAAWEPAPNPRSRITLGNETDKFGKKRAVLNWEVSEIDRRTVRECAIEVGRYITKMNYGRVKLFDWVLDPGLYMPGYDDGEEMAGYHHMGTTRMGTSDDDGVVDMNCKVFQIDNLYIAGSSVFPTGGHANPTYTIIQMALRLADHLGNIR